MLKRVIWLFYVILASQTLFAATYRFGDYLWNPPFDGKLTSDASRIAKMTELFGQDMATFLLHSKQEEITQRVELLRQEADVFLEHPNQDNYTQLARAVVILKPLMASIKSTMPARLQKEWLDVQYAMMNVDLHFAKAAGREGTIKSTTIIISPDYWNPYASKNAWFEPRWWDYFSTDYTGFGPRGGGFSSWNFDAFGYGVWVEPDWHYPIEDIVDDD